MQELPGDQACLWCHHAREDPEPREVLEERPFLPMTQRGILFNSYAFAKIIHLCCVTEPPKGVVGKLISETGDYLYQDTFERPCWEAALRDREEGGLGLWDLESRAKAMLIRTFLEMGANKAFLHRLWEENVIAYHVLGEFRHPEPQIPSFLKSAVTWCKSSQPLHSLDLSVATIKEIYELLLEEGVTRERRDTEQPSVLIEVRVELAFPDRDWARVWRRANLKGLAPEQKDTLFRHLHEIQGLAARTGRKGKNAEDPSNTECKLCKRGVDETLLHAIIECKNNAGGGETLTKLASLCSRGNVESLLCLDFDLKTGWEQDEEAVVGTMAVALDAIWSRRKGRLGSGREETTSMIRIHCLRMKSPKMSDLRRRMEELLAMLLADPTLPNGSGA